MAKSPPMVPVPNRVLLVASEPQEMPGVSVTRVSVPAAASALAAEKFPLVLFHEALVEADGGEGLRALCAQSQQRGGPPIVLLASAQVAPELLELAWRCGIDDCILRPVLAEAVRRRLVLEFHGLPARAAVAPRGRVTICGYDPAYQQRASELFKLSGYHVLSITPEAFAGGNGTAQGEVPDAVCAVAGPDKLQGLDLLSRTLGALRRGGLRERVHVAFVADPQVAAGALASGGHLTHVVDSSAPVEAAVECVNTSLKKATMGTLTRDRAPFFCPVDFREAGGSTVGEWQSGFSFNVSSGGIFVRTLVPVRKGAAVELRVYLTTTRQQILTTGVVAWSNSAQERAVFSSPVGMGISFLGSLSPMLNTLIEMCRATERERVGRAPVQTGRSAR